MQTIRPTSNAKSATGKNSQTNAPRALVAPIPPALLAVAQGRDHIKTAEFANTMCLATRTVHKNHCLTGECSGVRPIKRGKFLLWPVAAIAAQLEGTQNA